MLDSFDLKGKVAVITGGNGGLGLGIAKGLANSLMLVTPLKEKYGYDLAAKIAESGFQELPVSVSHTLALERLPLHHRDPFDHILLAQAQVEHLRLLTADSGLKPYGPMCQVISETA